MARKNLGEQFDYSVAVPMSYCSREFFMVDDAGSTSKLSDSGLGYGNVPMYRLGNSRLLPIQSEKQFSNEEVSSSSYATAVDPVINNKHHLSDGQGQIPRVSLVGRVESHLPTEEFSRSLKKSCRSNNVHSVNGGSSDRLKSMDKALVEEPLTEVVSEDPESGSVLTELPEAYIKHQIGDIEISNSNSYLKPADSSNTCYQSPRNSLYSGCGTQYTEAKDSFETMGVSEKSCGKVSESCDFVESRETSICRGSTESDVSDESSLGSFGSAIIRPHRGSDIRWEAIQAVRSQDGVLGLNHFRLLKRLGCGDIGSVYLSELSGAKSYYAMKVMDKTALAARKKLPRAQTEREILQSLDHPFLPTLYTHFETDKFSCLVMEFCPGGDLHALRQKQPGKHFPEHAARFYVAEILLALEYLHMLGIIYRDLKPENVLVRDDGHIMLSDFDLSLRCAVCPTLVKSSNTSHNLSKKNSCIEPSCVIQPSCMQPTCFAPRFLSSKSNKVKKIKKIKPRNEVYTDINLLPELMAEPTGARSMSFVGTHEYLAPEIIKGEGHGSAVDWWTFGIFLYELLFGKTPFKGSGNRATLFNVVGQPLRFPDNPNVSFAARDLIRGLLVKEPQHRLAYRRGATEVKQHPFFQNVNWALIRCTTPPDVPKPFSMDDLPGTKEMPMAKQTSENAPGVDLKPSGNYLEMEFF
ncbi:hypothetical protein GIB67_030836 [Kingdonia uniflora]|uniref:non-specific serine/threonine protein kinase n=1 Tax=Kingdonia uniflora TaxID=39325 RepID=A0A7J7L3C8_9MAGN|nr:hypothetical protein GIB67_030836 [Kingdonia uniflora]